jgi:dimethylaniline monooxygenase (N-oxide forming)
MMDYIHLYARHFDLYRYIRFHTRVVGIEFAGPEEEEVAAWEQWAGNGEAFGAGGTATEVWLVHARGATDTTEGVLVL